MKFNYQARTKEGTIKKGTIEAVSKIAAIDLLHKNGLYPTNIVEQAKKTGLSAELTLFDHVSFKDVVIFTRELAIMIESNVPPAKALEALAAQTHNKLFREYIFKIASDIREGITMSKAFSKYPKVFSDFYVNMLRSGELSGNLPEVLRKVADHLENNYYIKSKITGAMIYPIVVSVVFTIIFLVVVIFIIPGLVEVLEGAGSELPIVTKIVISVSDFFVSYWWIVLFLFICTVIFFIFYPKTKEGREVLDQIYLKIPIIGNFQKNINMNRFSENLATLIAAGKPITEALEVTSDIIGNTVYKKIITETKKRVIKGEKMSDVLVHYPQYVSPLFVQMVSVGESTGRLSETLLNVTRFYQREIETFVDSISSIIEPVLILGLAGMVGVLVAAVFLPLYQIGGAIS